MNNSKEIARNMIRCLKRNSSSVMKGANKMQKSSISVMTNPESSKSDKKQYRLIKLENNLKALLIHHDLEDAKLKSDDDESKTGLDDDHHAQKLSESSELSDSDDDESTDNEDDESDREKLAAVALCIGAGSFQDYDYKIEGLAHFVEHMIFMGSEKYPKENELDQFLNANGGSSNAETDCEHTLFYFDVVEEHLEGALDRFSNLFVSPLMLREAMNREMEAVESEFQNNINNDSDRIVQLISSKADGVAGTFTWGNLKTLRENVDGAKLYESAHEFRKKFYVAANMFLCIESAQSLDDLQDLVTKKFSDVVPGELHIRSVGDPNPFQKSFYDKICYVKPKSDRLKLYFTFVLPSMEKHYKTKPHDYIAYVIQYEGSGSLSAYLKENLLALHVEAGAVDQSFEGNSMFTLFGITILLTEKGYEKMNDVISATFSVLKMLKETSIEDHRRAFMELKQIRDTSFEFREEKPAGEYTEELAVNMMYYEAEDIIAGSDKFYAFDDKMTLQLIDMLNEGKFNLLILTDKHDSYKLTEKWFGTEYDEQDFPESIRDLWRHRTFSPSQFFIPKTNEFICTKFDIVAKHEKSQAHPLPLKIDFEGVELWYKLDDKFLLPHGFISCYLISPLIFKSTRNIILVSLFSMMVKHYLSESLYPAQCAGLGYSINSAERGLLIKLSGYNEKLPLLLELIMKELMKMPNLITFEVFETYKKQFKKNGYNALINSKSFNKECRLTILEDQHDFCYDRFMMLEDVKFDEVVAFAKKFPCELKVKLMVMGNFQKEEALKAAKILKENLQCQSIANEKAILPRCRKIPSGRHSLYVKSFLTNDHNSTITNYYQVDKSSIRNQSLIEFVEKLMEDPLFDILRTKEQLGYSVACSHRVNNGIIGFSITLQIQEEKFSSKFIDERIEKFLREDFTAFLKNLGEEDFEAVRQSLIKLKRIQDVEMESENSRYWNEITSNEYLFNRLDLEASMLERLTVENVKEFYEKILSSPKLSVQIIGCKEEEKAEEHVLKILQLDAKEGEKVITNIDEFKNSLEFYEYLTTIVDL